MKYTLIALTSLLFACKNGTAPNNSTPAKVDSPIAAGFLSVPKPVEERKIQMAILFDASGSMNGLLNQAKSHIWKIVNELSEYRYATIPPTVEIALYSYGYDGHGNKTGYVKQLVPLTTDLDQISMKLFSITTNGGSEFCGQVLSTSFQELEWSNKDEDLKIVYIAGNERFDQGPLDYKSICSRIKNANISINTIYCGDYNQGIRELWQHGASIGGGDYFNINSHQQIIDIPTPYDQDIQVLNDSLNNTYYGYGHMGSSRKSLQIQQDQSAFSMSAANQVERTISKSKSVYNNSSWDIVDAVNNGQVDLNKLEEDEKPEILKNLSEKEQEKVIETIQLKREAYQKQISLLAKKRSAYLTENQNQNSDLTFSTSLLNSLAKQAEQNGYKKID